MVKKLQIELFCDWLENYLNYERIPKKGEFSLETMRFLVERFKHPESAFTSVHVAGSKGKGSVSTMIAHIIEASGLSCGLYTSPHMIDFAERIGTAGGRFSDEIYGRSCDLLVPRIESIIPDTIPGNTEPSWFELVTLFAFIAFRESKIPWAVIETGLGGRLDATNVIIPKACVITPIELEHTEYLGKTIEKIAFEKAGIIKDGVPVFLAEQIPPARGVFEQSVRSHHSPLFSMEDAVKQISAHIVSGKLEVAIAFNTLEGGAVFSRPLHARLPMVSEIQAKNAALAAYAAKYLFPEIPEETIEAGLSRAWLPGRFEIISLSPGKSSPVVLDGAHTVRSITLTLETFRKLYPVKAHLLFACAADKDVDSMASLFSNGFSQITITRPGEKKLSDIDHASLAFTRIFLTRSDTHLDINNDYREAIEKALENAEKENAPLLVTGSFYLVTEAKKILERLRVDRGN